MLDCFAAHHELGATQLARELGVAKSTACRMLAALSAGGLLERAAGGRYRLSLRMFELGLLAAERVPVREAAARYELDEDLSDLSPLGKARSGEARSGERPRRPASGAKTRRLPLTIEGELIAKSTGAVSAFTLGDRVFHQKFGNGNVTAIDGNKLTIQFDKAGEKRVVDSFVERV